MRVPRPPANAVLALAALAFLSAWLSATASQEKKKDTKQPAKQTETKKEEPKKEEPKKEDTALFAGFHKSSAKGEQTQATASAGAKGAKPFGKQASGPPSSAARAKLLDMEEIKPKTAEMDAFVKEGGLKGASQ